MLHSAAKYEPHKDTASNAPNLFLVLQRLPHSRLLPVTIFCYALSKDAATLRQCFCRFCWPIYRLQAWLGVVQCRPLMQRSQALAPGGAIALPDSVAGWRGACCWPCGRHVGGRPCGGPRRWSAIWALFGIINWLSGDSAAAQGECVRHLYRGAKEGFQLLLSPCCLFLVAMAVAVGVLRASGGLMRGLTVSLGMVEGLGGYPLIDIALPTAFIKPLSGSVRGQLMIETMDTYRCGQLPRTDGGDLRRAGTETTPSTCSRCTCAVGITKRFATAGLRPAGGNLAGILTAIVFCYWVLC